MVPTLLHGVSTQHYFPAKVLASLASKIISLSPAIGSVYWFMTRSLYEVPKGRLYWCDILELTIEAKVKLKLWKENLCSYDPHKIWHSLSAVSIVYSDASDTGYGGYVMEHGLQNAHGMWTESESRKSSTWRELWGVRVAL